MFVLGTGAPWSPSKPTSKFGLDDNDSLIYPRSIKKELAKGQSFPEPKTVTTRAKAGSKRKKLIEPEEDSFEVERFVLLKAHQDKSLAEAEENLAGLRSIAAAKDKAISKLENEKKGLEEQLLHAKVGIHEAAMVAIDEAKVCAARAILQARIKMDQEATDPGFDRLAWDMDAWKQTLLQLGGETEPELVKAVEAGPSGAKEMAGGAREEAGGDEAATVGDEECCCLGLSPLFNGFLFCWCFYGEQFGL
ncbi:hypothetical protein HanPI659440_Chr08g0296621 [Helianthus annuus]|nr:hypothetical protein HanPI659440_Chr08g0296621 [Helianthus annuus]